MTFIESLVESIKRDNSNIEIGKAIMGDPEAFAADPVKVTALFCCEFAEKVTVEAMVSDKNIAVIAWLHLRHMAKFIRRDVEKASVTT